ncbi:MULTISPECIES: hypothetical protein [Streptococcus]|uniref:SMI1/KNR4 family protein n=1 Tax=Streptococcus koreensis TaxID=2382163 RepID=A0ABN5Q0A0_9STRE|nr:MULTISPECIES: hypothetical protein [Streptococcus]AGY37793.1 hypothetical protein N597_02330 [Streptococcus ilei]AYF94872.1 hypothetical protein D7D50_09880 [Streptococcus koreensis]RJU50427.1 hypothetical protein DW738_00650 [Streptococcus sp. AM28-20]
MKNYLLDERIFQYPESFKKLIELNLVDFDIWYLLDSEWALSLYEGLQERYPTRKLIPFAKRGDCDDTACFEIGKGNKVQLIHDFATEGWEQRKEFNDFWEWVEYAVKCMIEYNKEDGIE